MGREEIIEKKAKAARERNSILAHSEDTTGHFSNVMLDGCQVSLVLMPFHKRSWTLVHFPGCVGRDTASRMQVKTLQ